MGHNIRQPTIYTPFTIRGRLMKALNHAQKIFGIDSDTPTWSILVLIAYLLR